jgi:hypothetical protein
MINAMKYTFFVAIVFLMSCGREQKHPQQRLKQFEVGKPLSLTLNIDDRTIDWPGTISYYLDKKTEKEQIIILNQPTNSIQFYGMDGDLEQETFCQKSGPNTTGGIQSFLYCGKDSLFVLNIDNQKVYRLSQEGVVLDVYHLPIWQKPFYSTLPYSTTGVEMSLFDNHLYVPGEPAIFYFESPTKFLTNGKLGLNVNLTTGKVVDHINYPNIPKFSKKNYSVSVINARCTSNQRTKKLIYSFPSDHTIYLYGLNGKLEQTHDLRSKHIADFEEMDSWKNVNDPIKVYQHYLRHSYYEGLFYDKFRDLYFRLVKHGTMTEYTHQDIINKKPVDCKYSLIVANGDFQIINEIELEPGARHQLTCVTKDGILILDKSEPKEDEINFRLYPVGG